MTALLTHLLRTGLVLVAIAAVAHLLRGTSARTLHRLWWLGLVQLVVPVGWLASRLLPETTLDVVALPAGWSLAADMSVDAIAPASGGLPWLTVAWMAGAAFLLIRLTVAVLRARILFRRSGPAGGRLAAVAAGAGVVPRHVRLCTGLALPAVAGLVAPRILVPAHLADGLSDHELAAVLRHEDAHRRRRDPLRFALARMLRALVWWHPGAWWALRNLETTAEYACDESAAPDPAAGEHLADGLARSLRLATHLDHAVLPASLAGGHVPLRRRLQRLTLDRRSPSMTTVRLLVILAVLCAGAGALLAVPAPPAPPADPAPVSDPEPAPPAPTASPAADPAPAPATPEPTQRKPVEPTAARNDEQPKLIEFVAPEYPEDAKAEGAEGTVTLVLRVDATGRVTEILKETFKDGDPDPRLIGAARAAAMECRFEPARKDGVAVISTVMIPFKFVAES